MALRLVSWPLRLLAAAVSAGVAAAQEPGQPPGDYWDPFVVTPTGQASRVSEAPSTTFVITGDEVRHSGATSLPEILRRVPGLDVRLITATDGQLGLRGFAYEVTDRILVLVDGRTAYVDFFGGTAYEMLPVSLVDIDRIEVVLGPGASVYGNKAMLGTVNVITRSAGDYPFAEARLDAGTPEDGRAAVRYGAIGGSWRTRATAIVRRLSLYQRAGSGPSDAAGGTFTAIYQPSAGADASLELGGVGGDTYMIPTASQIHRFDAVTGYLRAQGTLGLGGPGSPGGKLHLDLVWNAGQARSATFPGTDGFRATFHTPYARLHHELRTRALEVPMQVRWGGEVRLNTLDSTITSNERPIWNVAAFASDEVLLGRWRVTAGLRLDRSLDRIDVSPRASVVWSPAEHHQIRAAFNTGYNNATALQYYSNFRVGEGASSILILGNRDLRDERVLYGELGWAGWLTRSLRGSATAFAYRFDDWISLKKGTTLLDPLKYGNNANALEIYGSEVGLEVTVRPAFSAYATYALVRATQAKVPPYGIEPQGSPRHKIGAGVRYDLAAGLYLTADAQYFGRSTIARIPNPPDPKLDSFPYKQTPLESYLMSHARLGYAFGNGLDLSLAASNVLDDRTQQLPGGERPERRIMMTLARYR